MQHLKVLNYVDAVARAGSIRAAAERLQVAASAVNRRIQDLERELGTKVFERLPGGVRLTAAGELFVAYLRRRTADLEQVRSEIEALSGVRRGSVSIAGSQAVAPWLLPRAIVDFQAEFPGVAFDAKVLDRERAVQALLDFDVDLALVFNPPATRGTRILAQARQRTCALVPEGHPLARRRSVRLSECLRFPVALPDETLSGRGVLDELLDTSSARPRPQLQSNSFELMRGFARACGGIHFQIEVGAGEGTGAVAIPIEDRGLPTGRLVLLALRSRVLPVAAARFAETLAQRLHGANQRGA